eukprot:gene40780-55127_t
MLSAPALAQERDPALAPRLAYVITNDAQVDSVSRMGLAGLSDFVTRRTAATLADPAGVVPGRDDLAFYPLLYWPITPDADAPDGAAIAALNEYMAHGGIILIDTRNGGSGEGFADGADAALTRLAKGLAVPPLAALTPTHVLGRAFYLLQDFPGRFTGDTVWVQRDQDRSNDSVSPVIIGGHDWAAAWAVDAQGRNPYATIPGGARQRTLAYRFGVNLVMYALTGAHPGHPGAAGAVKLETALAALRFDPTLPLPILAALAALCQSYHGVICSDAAHVQTDECGAPEFFSNGSKLLVAPSTNGKLTPEAIRAIATNRKDIHFPKPRVVTITQPTETGLIYSLDEVKAISAVCRDLGLSLHMDGSRFANACAGLGCTPADITWRAGVDVLCFGGTKNGIAVGEAIIFFNRKLAEDFDYRCKQAGQLASKMRFLSAPWVRMLES